MKGENNMNEDMKVVCEVKDKVLDLLHQANQTKEFSMGDVDFLYKATKTVKNACEIEDMMGEDGYSETQDSGNYGRGSSYTNRGKHWVRGHYSRNGGRDNYNPRRDGRNGYSREDGRSEMMEHLEMAMDSATDQDRETIKRFMRQLENA